MDISVAGFYRRVLPSPPAIEFASPDGKQLFSEALQSGTMEGFFNLISHFQTQSEPAYCGLATLAVVLNALAIDPGRKWKGPWRWYDETMLDCCDPLEKIKAEGISFGKVACLAHCAGARVEAFRTDRSTIEAFREHAVKCATSQDCHMIVSYHRRHFKQTGTGHFSPIGGYHAGSDMVLILDVARFKYPPHWVPLTLLWEAMDTIDQTTGSCRGFMLISKFQRAPSLLYTMNCRHESWVATAKFLLDELPLLLKSEDLNSIPEILSLLVTSLPFNSGDFVKWIAEIRRQEDDTRKLSKEEESRLAVKEKVLRQVHEMELFRFLRDWLSFESPCCRNTYQRKWNTLPELATSDYCQGMELLMEGVGATKGFCCMATCVSSMKSAGDCPVAIVSGNVVSCANEQQINMLLPVSQLNPSGCCSSVMHPGSSDVLTVLLLALPPHTWSGIRNEQLLAQIRDLVSSENLPDVLQEEVLHLQRQLHFLKRCKDNKVDCDLDQ